PLIAAEATVRTAIDRESSPANMMVSPSSSTGTPTGEGLARFDDIGVAAPNPHRALMRETISSPPRLVGVSTATLRSALIARVPTSSTTVVVLPAPGGESRTMHGVPDHAW